MEREEKHVLGEVTGRESRVGQQRKRLEELQVDAERLPKLEADLAQVRGSLNELAAPSKEVEQQRLHVQDLQSQALHLKEVNVALRAEMDDLRVKVDLLQEASGPDGVGAKCPLCGEDLGEEGCQHLAVSYETQGRQKATSHRENEAFISQVELERTKLEEDVVIRELESLGIRQKEEGRRDLLFKAVEGARATGDMAGQLTGALESEESLLQANRQRLQEVQLAMPPLKEAAVLLSGVLDAQGEAKLQLDAIRKTRIIAALKVDEPRELDQGHAERLQRALKNLRKQHLWGDLSD